MYWPVFLNMKFQKILVIGGGKAAERKLGLLQEYRKLATVISPEININPDLLKGVTVKNRKVRMSECSEYSLIFSCTDNLSLNRKILRRGRKKGALVFAAGDALSGDFITASIVTHKNITAAVSSGGKERDAVKAVCEKIGALLNRDEVKGNVEKGDEDLG